MPSSAWPLGTHPDSRIWFRDHAARTCEAILPTAKSMQPLQTAVTLLNQFLTPQLGASFRPHIWVRKYRFLIFRRVPDLIILVPGYGGQNLVQKMIPKRIVLYNCFEHAVRCSAALQPKFDPEAGPCFWAVVFWLTQKAQSSSALSSSLSSALSH